MTPKLVGTQAAVVSFAREAHKDQKRKYTGDPYFNHVLAVASLVYDHDDTLGLFEIAILHDVLEDTNKTIYDIRRMLYVAGYDENLIDFIDLGVTCLTDLYTKESYPELNRAARKKLEAERLSNIPAIYQTVKYADILHNTMDIVINDPKFAKTYVPECLHLLDVMRLGNLNLLMLAYASLKKDWDKYAIKQ